MGFLFVSEDKCFDILNDEVALDIGGNPKAKRGLCYVPDIVNGRMKNICKNVKAVIEHYRERFDIMSVPKANKSNL